MTTTGYLEPFCKDFGSLEELSALALPLKTVSRPVDVVDPAVFDALGISFLGHKLLIAKGIRLLHQRQ